MCVYTSKIKIALKEMGHNFFSSHIQDTLNEFQRLGMEDITSLQVNRLGFKYLLSPHAASPV